MMHRVNRGTSSRVSKDYAARFANLLNNASFIFFRHVPTKRRKDMKSKKVCPSFAKSTQLALVLSIGAMTFVNATAQTAPFMMSSPDLSMGTFDNKHVLNGFGCSGGNLSPALQWS